MWNDLSISDSISTCTAVFEFHCNGFWGVIICYRILIPHYFITLFREVIISLGGGGGLVLLWLGELLFLFFFCSQYSTMHRYSFVLKILKLRRIRLRRSISIVTNWPLISDLFNKSYPFLVFVSLFQILWNFYGRRKLTLIKLFAKLPTKFNILIRQRVKIIKSQIHLIWLQYILSFSCFHGTLLMNPNK